MGALKDAPTATVTDGRHKGRTGKVWGTTPCFVRLYISDGPSHVAIRVHRKRVRIEGAD
jgi:hypothetical protein